VTVDKTEWEQGPWISEVDKKVWIDPNTKLKCIILRGPSGSLCGYVGVPKDHPFYGLHHDDNNIEQVNGKWIDVHGGLTYSDYPQIITDMSDSLCFSKEEVLEHLINNPNHDTWYFGFDCAHAGDTCPKYDNMRSQYRQEYGNNGDSYKDMGYVTRQVTHLAYQLKR